MSRFLDIRPRARVDITEYAIYIAEDSIDAAMRFLAAADATLEAIAAHPGRGHPRELINPGLTGVRACPIEGFPNHLVFYRVPDESSVRIIRIRHGAMNMDVVDMEG